MSMTDRAPLAEVIEHARVLADALANLPANISTPTHVHIPTYAGADHVEINWLLFSGDFEAQKAAAADVIHILGGKWDKEPGDDLFGFTQRRGQVEFNVMVNRAAVCQRVVTGTREVTTMVPAADAPMVESVETIETVEWVCEPLLANAGA